ncbi:hypothetical protein MY4038_004014 [Beauveria bassiana]
MGHLRLFAGFAEVLVSETAQKEKELVPHKAIDDTRPALASRDQASLLTADAQALRHHMMPAPIGSRMQQQISRQQQINLFIVAAISQFTPEFVVYFK